MGIPGAKLSDQVVGVDVHILLIPAAAGVPVPTPVPHPFSGQIVGNVSPNVLINGLPAATLGSTAQNMPPHIPLGAPFAVPPTNMGTLITGSPTVLINNKPAARTGDPVMTCNDPVPAPTCSVVSTTVNVLIGP